MSLRGQGSPSKPSPQSPAAGLHSPLFVGPRVLALFQTPSLLPATVSLLKLKLIFKSKQNHQEALLLPVKASGLMGKHLIEERRAAGTPFAQGKGQSWKQTVKAHHFSAFLIWDIGLSLAFLRFLYDSH